MAAGVGVIDEFDGGARVAANQRHSQRVQDEVGAHVLREPPADNSAAEGVDDDRVQVDAVEVGAYGPRRLRAFQERPEPVLWRSRGLADGVADRGVVGDGGGERGVLRAWCVTRRKKAKNAAPGSSASTSADRLGEVLQAGLQ